MNCREIIDFLMAYIDGELEPEQRRVFDVHLGCCPPCVDYLESYRQAVRLGRQVLTCDDDAPLPEGMPERLLAAIRKAKLEG